MGNFAILHVTHDYVYAESKFLEVELLSQWVNINISLMWTDDAKLPTAGGRPAYAPSSNVGESAYVSKAYSTQFVFKFLPFMIHFFKKSVWF